MFIERQRHSPNGAFNDRKWYDGNRDVEERARQEFVVFVSSSPTARHAADPMQGGYRLIEEIFQPGKYPDLSDLAIIKRSKIVDPDTIPARVMTHEEYRRSTATARLSRFTAEHLGHLQRLYHQIAYPGVDFEPLSQAEIEENVQYLRAGNTLGYRTGTKYLNCAKHNFVPDKHRDSLKASMYLNYYIPVGPVRLIFREDIDMALEYGESAKEYFEAQGITV